VKAILATLAIGAQYDMRVVDAPLMVDTERGKRPVEIRDANRACETVTRYVEIRAHGGEEKRRRVARHLAAMPFDSSKVMLFDFTAQRWEEIARVSVSFPNWSRTGECLYFLHEQDDPSVMRLRIRDRKIERVADLKNFRQTALSVTG
jgi:hypothetical protein